MAEITITKENFEEKVLRSEKPVIVDFWATWCGPCRMLAPELAAFAEENEAAVTVGKVNVDEEPELAERFGVMSIPTLIAFRDGQKVRTAVGYRPKSALAELLS